MKISISWGCIALIILIGWLIKRSLDHQRQTELVRPGQVWVSAQDNPFLRKHYTVVAVQEGYVQWSCCGGGVSDSETLSDFVYDRKIETPEK